IIVEIEGARLRNTTAKNKVDWVPNYENSTSQEYIQLYNLFCELFLSLANSTVPQGSDGGKCLKVSFAPADRNQYNKRFDSAVVGQSTLTFKYPVVLDVIIDTLKSDLESKYESARPQSILKANNAKFNETRVIPLEQPTTVLLSKITNEHTVYYFNYNSYHAYNCNQLTLTILVA
ncbi:hypothetical protein MN116_008124, partial [Schistosoma mekongi]